MKILFLHQHFPGQFGRLATWMGSQPEHQVAFLTRHKEFAFPGVRKIMFRETRQATPKIHYYLKHVEEVVLQGQAAFRSAMALRQEGFIPDVVYGHCGFGATSYIKDAFPEAPFIGYFEWYFRSHGSDNGFDPKYPVSPDDECRIRTRNLMFMMDLVSCYAGVVPTHWQHDQFPAEFSQKLQVIHDGIDTSYFSPAKDAKLILQTVPLDLSAAKEIVTYVGRGMEPYRGFPQFMEAVSILQKRRKNCHVVVVGTDTVVYGAPDASGKTYKELMLDTFEYDLNRLHFTGPLPYVDYQRVLQASTVHTYLTYPYILSWSMIEAMSCGCALVASNTAPVREVVEDEHNGLLVDFFSPQALADKIERALDDAKLRRRLGAAARQTTLDRYDMDKLMPQHYQLLAQFARCK